MGKGKLDPSPELLLIQLFRFSMVAHCPWGRVKGFHGEFSPFQLATTESVEDGLGGNEFPYASGRAFSSGMSSPESYPVSLPFARFFPFRASTMVATR
jgi:hypothetical protein